MARAPVSLQAPAQAGSLEVRGGGPMRVDVEAISVSFADRIVLREVSLTLGPGDVVTIRGESGSGKSTLLRALAGLVAIDAGRIVFDGRDIRTLPMPEHRRRVAYVPQSPRMFDGTVADNVRAGPGFGGHTLSDDDVAVFLERAGLSSAFAPRSASELSGGEQLRVGLARALANEPRVLLLDEPTSALDPEAARQLTTRVTEFARAGNAVIAVTHVDEHARQLGGRTYSMTAGELR